MTADPGIGRPNPHRPNLPIGSIEAEAAIAAPQGLAAAGDALADDELSAAPQPRLRTIKRLIRRPKFVIGATLFGVIVLLAVLAPVVGRYGPDTPEYTALNQNPSSAHIMGTDYLGRDMWSRLVWGGRTSVPAGCLIVIMSFVIGVPWGIIAGFGNKLIDDVLMRLIDVLLALPGLVLAMSIVAILGPSIRSVIVALGIAGIPGYARVARASTLTTKNLDYVLAARTLGGGPWRIMRAHVLRNIVSPLVILATLNLSGAILAAAALSFLGIGTQLPAADWGTMLSNGFNYMFESSAQVVFPSLFIVVTVLGINLMGDALGEVLNPQLHH